MTVIWLAWFWVRGRDAVNEAALMVTVARRPALQSLTQECLYFRGHWGESDTRSPQHCRQLERALKLCKGYVSKKEMKFLNFLRQKRGGKETDSLF